MVSSSEFDVYLCYRNGPFNAQSSVASLRGLIRHFNPAYEGVHLALKNFAL